MRIAHHDVKHQTLAGLGLLLSAAVGIQCHQGAAEQGAAVQPTRIQVSKPQLASASVTADIESQIEADPLAFLLRCRENYDRRFHQYSCMFTKQELIDGALTNEQRMMVSFREEPFSVNMRWVAGAVNARQVTYIEDRWPDAEGTNQAWCKPAGAIASIFIKKILQPIHGDRAKAESRRTIDQFGFANTLDLIIKYAEISKKRGEMDLRYAGRGSINGRPTYVIERRLPYNGTEDPYPDRLGVFHIDTEWLLPTASFSYADDQGKQLLGRYLLTEPDFSQNFADADFSPETLR
jgi:hypothetical protein